LLGVVERNMEPSQGWWNDYGFASLGEYLKVSYEEGEKVATLFSRRKRSRVPTPRGPSGASPEPRPIRAGRNRQVSIRLDDEGYENLAKAARIYGVAPSTMARLLVQKGARLAAEEES
jgi:hypothetical protein